LIAFVETKLRRGDFMKKIIFLAILSALMLQGCKTAGHSAAASEGAKKEAKVELDPVKIFWSSAKGTGNCSACHAIPADTSGKPAGNMGPPMVGMKARFPDIAKLKAAIEDQKAFSPQTMMPPFGRNKILTPEQIDVVAQYIYQY
jgi:sulfur oxidation c-type cytochrome SoxX